MSSLLTNPGFPKILVATSFPPDVPGGSPLASLSALAWHTARPGRLVVEFGNGSAPFQGTGGHFQKWGAAFEAGPPSAFHADKKFSAGNILGSGRRPEFEGFYCGTKTGCSLGASLFLGDTVLHRVVLGLGIPWHMTVHDLADSSGLVRSLGARRTQRFQKMIDDLYVGAVSRDVYMKETGDEMERVTGCKADIVIRCGAEPEEMASVVARPVRALSDKIRIGYPGTIVSDDAFARFIAALKLIAPRFPRPVEINLFGVHSYRSRPWFDDSFIVEHGYLPEDELERRYNNCDWGLALMDLDDSNPRYSRFTFPCKFTRALVAGLPIIVVGHPECTLTQLSRRYRLGPVITTPEPQAMADILLPVLSQPADSPALRAEIVRCLESEFNAELNRQRLHELFRAAAKHRVSR